MNQLVISYGADPAKEFDKVLDAAHLRTFNSGKTAEQYFVRELISETTLRELNTAASIIYDRNFNIVQFAGAFIHGRPYAEYQATSGNASKHCRRELADAIVLLNETQQDGTGMHKVVRSAACMLMFKKSNAATPLCNSYNPKGGLLPNGTDQEQFYLFNQWPSFDLLSSVGTPILGKGSYSLAVNSVVPRNVGKYAILWSPNAQSACGWGGLWRFSDAIPSAPISDSLGALLSRMASADISIGATYDSAKPTSDWDRLVVDLHSYAKTHDWLGGRLKNPANISFLEARISAEESLATLLQPSMRLNVIANLLHIDDPWKGPFYSKPTAKFLDESDDITPIICLTVSSFRSQGNADQTELSKSDTASKAYSALQSLGFTS